jgi:hypothetical protein
LASIGRSIGQSIGTIVKIGLVAGCVYALLKWNPISPQDDGSIKFAEKACTDEIGTRFNGSNVRIYAVTETNDGYVVRASISLDNGNIAKVVCLTNTHGSVREVMIEER